MNLRLVHDFITTEEQLAILKSDEIKPTLKDIENEHIKKVHNSTNGWSVLKDLTNTEVSRKVAQFQGDSSVVETVPQIFEEIAKRIAKTINISGQHVFFQYIVIGEGGRVHKHYDASLPGYVNYKCNVCIEGPKDDVVYVDKDALVLNNRDLYCFEANLFKHWLETSATKRIHLSYGFLIPNENLGWKEDSPRVRLSNRIWKAFINKGV